jgi:hypothetical protein
LILLGPEKIKDPVATNYGQISGMKASILGWDNLPIGKTEWFHSIGVSDQN